jgi:hypothetical protein
MLEGVGGDVEDECMQRGEWDAPAAESNLFFLLFFDYPLSAHTAGVANAFALGRVRIESNFFF